MRWRVSVILGGLSLFKGDGKERKKGGMEERYEMNKLSSLC